MFKSIKRLEIMITKKIVNHNAHMIMKNYLKQITPKTLNKLFISKFNSIKCLIKCCNVYVKLMSNTRMIISAARIFVN